jgi:hypothetical protein
MSNPAKATRTLNELETLVTEIEGNLLQFASSGARSEWSTFRESCVSAESDLTKSFGTAHDDLEILVSKARRFRAVLLMA